jgi:hypothetical protein
VTSVLRPAREGVREVVALIYKDSHAQGHVTGLAFGVSAARHPNWPAGGRELCITMRSGDREWGKLPARLAASLQGMHSFDKRLAVGYAGLLVEDSKMNSLVFADPAIPQLRDWAKDTPSVSTDGTDIVELISIYPIYSTERHLVYSSGFWRPLGTRMGSS